MGSEAAIRSHRERDESAGRAPGRELSLGRRLLFSSLAIVLFLGLVEALLWGLGVEPASRTRDPYLGFTSTIPLFVVDPEDESRLVTAGNRLRFFNRQSFDREKKDGTQRVFCLGGSTTYGRPYEEGTSFCGWLRELLAAAAPEQRWEVVNAGGVSYASYRVAVILEELTRYEPDLFVLYTGHNEFLESRTYREILELPPWLREALAVATRLRSVTLLETLLGRLLPDGPEPDQLGAEVETLLDRSVGPDAYHRDDGWRRGVLRHFRSNLARMAKMAEGANAELLVITPACNLRDAAPFKSEPGVQLGDVGRSRWRASLDHGRSALEAGRAEEAIEILEEATRLDARYADAWMLLGRALDAAGRFEEAALAFRHARDEDVCPLRAPTDFVEAVREAASEEGLAEVDFESWVGERAPQGIPGREHFLDHVHPTIDTHRELALEILDALVAAGRVELRPDWSEALVSQVAARVESQIDPADHAEALVKLSKVLGWAGKLEEALDAAERAVARLPRDGAARYQAGLVAQLLGRLPRAIEHYQVALEVRPDEPMIHGNLAAAYEASGDLEAAVRHFRRAAGLDPGSAARRGFLEEAEAKLRESGGSGAQETALAELRQRVGEHPEDDSTRHRLVTELLLRGQGDEAKSVLEEAIEGDLGIVATHRAVLGSLLYRNGDVASAVVHFERALEEIPNLAEAALNLAFIRATSADPELRDPGEALRWARHAASLTGGGSTQVQDVLAAALASAGRYEEAAATLERSIEVTKRQGGPLPLEVLEARLRLYRGRSPLVIASPRGGAEDRVP